MCTESEESSATELPNEWMKARNTRLSPRSFLRGILWIGAKSQLDCCSAIQPFIKSSAVSTIHATEQITNPPKSVAVAA